MNILQLTRGPLSAYEFKEIILPTEIPRSNPSALYFEVPQQFHDRRIYTYLEVLQSPADASFILAAEVRCYLGRTLRARFPAVIGDVSLLTTNESLPSLLNGGGSPVGDSLVLRLANPFNNATKITSAVLQPIRVNAEIDGVGLSLTGAFGANVAGWRAYLGCLSMGNV